MTTTAQVRRVEALLNVIRRAGSEGITGSKLSAELGVSASTVRNRVMEARDALSDTKFALVTVGRGPSARYILTADRELIDEWVAGFARMAESIGSRIFDYAPNEGSMVASAKIMNHATEV